MIADQRTSCCHDTSQCHWQQDFFNGERALFQAKQAGTDCTGNKEHQIDAPGCFRFHSGNQRQPNHQKAATANSKPGQKSQQRTNNHSKWKAYGHRYWIPPHKIINPRIR